MRQFFWLFFLLPFQALASVSSSQATQQVAEGSTAGLTQWLASSFLVLLLIIGLGWALKKSRLVPNLGREDFKVIYTLPVGVKEKLLVVQAGDEQLLLGVTAQQISFLSKIEPPLMAQPTNSVFANQLAKFLNKSPEQAGPDHEK